MGRAGEGSEARPRWLSEEEMAAWLPLIGLVTRLPQALDRQLREDAGISHVYYQLLAMLSLAPDRQLRMGELAGTTGISLSRLSHAVAALEIRGWVTRCPASGDGRGQLAQLTDGGQQLLDRTAPGHVAEVRRFVFDALTTDELDQLGHLARKLLDNLPS